MHLTKFFSFRINIISLNLKQKRQLQVYDHIFRTKPSSFDHFVDTNINVNATSIEGMLIITAILIPMRHVLRIRENAIRRTKILNFPHMLHTS